MAERLKLAINTHVVDERENKPSDVENSKQHYRQTCKMAGNHDHMVILPFPFARKMELNPFRFTRKGKYHKAFVSLFQAFR